jgi:acyl-coenzyme A synthetase/AMP-(fatty) acid ligase
VAPSEIESVVEKLEGVELVSAVGIVDDVVGAFSAVAVKKKKGFEHLAEKTIEDFAAENLSIHKQLHGGVYFVNDFPKTASGKIQKRFVRDILTKLRNERILKEAKTC